MIAVVACGNANRSDDGAAAEVLRRLADRGGLARSPQVKLLDAGVDGLAVMFAARGARALIVVDACRSGAEAGVLFEVPGELLARERAPSLSTHDFRWDDALAVGRRVLRDDFPADVSVLLIEGAAFGFGVELSRPVAAAVPRAVERIEAMLGARLQVRIARGGLHLSAGLCAEVFAGLEAVVLLRRDEDLLVLPVRHAAAGGYLLKRRNAAGDRRVEAADFLRAEGIEDGTELSPAWGWDEAAAALRLSGVFAAAPAGAPMLSSAGEPA